MRIFSTLLLLCLLTACASPTATPPTATPVIPTPTVPAPPLTGQWIGAATKPDGMTASLQLMLVDSEWKLNIEPYSKLWKLTFEQNNETIHFIAIGGVHEIFQKIDFAGTFANGVFSGELDWDGTKNAITFTSIVSVDKTVLEKYEGVYRFESGRALSIIVSPEYSWSGMYFFSQSLMLTDFESGVLRGLYPFDDHTFGIGVLRVAGAPFAGRIQFVTDEQGNPTGLRWWDDVHEAGDGQVAARIQYKKEDVTFTSADGIKLAGFLSLPESTTPMPAFMMLHGSERGTRDDLGNKLMEHFMVSRGIAILTYDKRGVGDSEGVYKEAASPSNLQKHAEDAIAGVEYLVSRPEIDRKRIGLIGGSQAGWVIPLAASQSDAITHLVIMSGPVASTSHEGRFSDYTNDGESITPYDDTKITQELRDMNPGGFDPIPIIAELKQTALWLWGGVDKSQPVTYGAENLQFMIDSGKNNFSYQIFPNADHGLTVSPHGLFAEIPYSPAIVFYPALTEWLDKYVIDQKEHIP